ncbi:MAG: cyanophycin synthetase, partial [Planctomycetaceae bacterium]|nr:cyanophycin synthetase [Planctomycetaceae bacterium]
IRRDPPQVVGDGRATIDQLVERLNSDPRRGHNLDFWMTPLFPINFDATALAVLAEQGYAPDTVLPAGVAVLIRRNTHRKDGGTATDVTDRVHPEVAERALDAARVVGLDVAGIDVVTPDIGRPLEEQGGVIIEVNAEPSLFMHLIPTSGAIQPVGQAIVDLMFPEGETGRIPIVAVTGTNGKTTTTRVIAHILRATGRTIGMTCSDGIYVDRRRIEAGDCSGPNSARTVLLNPTVEAAVLETARGGILTGGLGFDRCDVAVVTNVGEGDHVGSHGIHTVEELASVKSTVITVVAPGGTVVLNAADPRVAAMAVVSPAPVIYFARDADDPNLVRHRSEGGKAVFVRDGSIVLAEGDREEPLVPLVRVPMTHEGRAGFQVENALAGSAAAYALGVPPETIRAALGCFAGDPELSPGRFNVLQARGATLIIDYAHNASALAALVEALEQFPHRERLMVYSAAGNRRDADILRQGEILGNGFDRVILYEDQCAYGRPDGETIALLRQGLAAGSRVSQVHATRGEFTAIETALNQLRPDDLAVIGPESVEEALAFVERRLDVHPPVER